MDVSRGRKLYFLVDSGADVSLVKSEKLLSEVEFEPRDRVRIKSMEGSVVETHGSVEAQILEGELSVPIKLQLVSKQVDFKGDGILGRDILRARQARICYNEQMLTFQVKGTCVRKRLTSIWEVEPWTVEDGGANKLTLPARTEVLA
jgi:predicted aspartyl protease